MMNPIEALLPGELDGTNKIATLDWIGLGADLVKEFVFNICFVGNVYDT